MANVKDRLQLKKAMRFLTEEVRDYIAAIKDLKKANLILSFAYKYNKKHNGIVLSDFSALIDRLDSRYTPKKEWEYFEYGKLLSYLEDIDDDTLNRCVSFLQAENMNKNDKEIGQDLVLCGVSDDEIALILKNEETVRKLADPTLYDTAYSRFDSYAWTLIRTRAENLSSLFHRYLQSTLIQELLASPMPFFDAESRYTGNFHNIENLLLFCENTHLPELRKGKHGYPLLADEKKRTFFTQLSASCQKKNAEMQIEHEEDNEFSEFCYTYTDARELDHSAYYDYFSAQPGKMCQDIVLSNLPAVEVNLYVYTDRKNHAIFKISYSNNTKVHFGGEEKITYSVWNEKTVKFVIYNKDQIYFSKLGYPFRPACLKDLVTVAMYQKEVRALIEEYLLSMAKEHPFFKDIHALFCDILDFDQSTPPILINDCFYYHNWDMYFKAKYKDAKTLGVNFSKINPIVSYSLIKIAKYIPKRDLFLYLDAATENPNIANMSGTTMRERVEECLFQYYRARLNLNGTDLHTNEPTIRDWIHFSLEIKEPLSLRKTSIRKIIDQHLKTEQAFFLKKNYKKKDVTIIKKDSKFANLRALLPPEFEWITEHNRLLFESKIQHHCVRTYESRIRQDVCTIYSYINPRTGNRHTIEFRIAEDGTYYVNQIQKCLDRGYDDGVLEFINSLLEKQEQPKKIA